MILNQQLISSLTVYNMTIFDQTRVDRRPQPPLLIQYGGQTTMIHQMAPTVFYFQTLYLQDIKSSQPYPKVHSQPNWARRVAFVHIL